MILVKPSFEILAIMDGDRYGDPLGLIETAGRTCYKSEDRITEDSAQKFVEMITMRGHHSVLEHSAMTVKIICDRGVTHEIVRHRLCAYSQESTRYCNYKGGVTFIIPPWVDIAPGDYPYSDINSIPIFWSHQSRQWGLLMLRSEWTYKELLDCGWSPQQARSVLPNALKTEIVITANLREWRHIFTLRCSKAAHPQMCEVMIPLLAAVIERIPVIFNDLIPFVERT